MMSTKRSGGIVLVTTLLMMVLVVMMVTVVVYAGSGGMALTGNFYEREAALMAADSGLQYAMTRLQTNGNWRGNGTDIDASGIAAAGFSVIERDGNVIGFLTTTNGHASQFRIKFNYEDGPAGQDGLDNSQSGRELRSPLVSVNNLLSVTARPVRRANKNGIGVDPAPATYSVPRKTACIIVEGLAGWGLREATKDNPYQVVEGRGITRRVVEAYLTLDNSEMADSVAYSGGSIDANLPSGGKFAVSTKDDDVVPRLRTLNNVEINPTGGGSVNYDDGSNGEVSLGTAESNTFTLNNSPAADERVMHNTTTENFKSLNKLTWDSIAKAGSTDTKMPAGTYVWRVDSSGPYLEYFDVELAGTEPLPEAGTGRRIDTNNVTSSGDGVAVDTAGMALLMSKNVLVEPSENGATSLAIRTDPEVTATARRPTVAFTPPPGSTKSPILTAAGSVRLEGAVLGSGSVTSESEITFQGPSVLEADPETGVSLYAKGDITVESIPAPVASLQGAVADYIEAELMAGHSLPSTGQIQDFLLSDAGQATLSTITTNLTRGGGGAPDVMGPGGDDRDDDDGDNAGGPYTRGGGPPMGLPEAAKAYGVRAQTTSSDGLTADYMERKEQQLEKILAKFGRIDYADQSLTGVIYTWKNFNANLGGNGLLHVTGTLVAYGGIPNGTNEATAGSSDGNINITAGGVDLVYDSSYIQDLLNDVGSVRVRRSLWATY